MSCQLLCLLWQGARQLIKLAVCMCGAFVREDKEDKLAVMSPVCLVDIRRPTCILIV